MSRKWKASEGTFSTIMHIMRPWLASSLRCRGY